MRLDYWSMGLVSFLSSTVQVEYARLVSWSFPLCIMKLSTTHVKLSQAFTEETS